MEREVSRFPEVLAQGRRRHSGRPRCERLGARRPGFLPRTSHKRTSAVTGGRSKGRALHEQAMLLRRLLASYNSYPKVTFGLASSKDRVLPDLQP